MLCVAIRFWSFLGLLLSKGLQPSSSSQDDFNVPDDYQQASYYTLIICVIASWLHILFHLMAFESTGPFVLTLYMIITKDVPYFFGFFSIIWLSLGCALALLTKAGNHSISTNFAHLIQVWWTLIKVTVGFGDDFNVQYVPIGMEWFYDGVRTAYGIAVTILMINLLIAMMSNTYEAYSTNSHYILLMQKYNFLCAMQRVGIRGRVTPAVERDLQRYSTEETLELEYDSKDQTGKRGLGYLRKEVLKQWYFQLENYQDSWFVGASLQDEGVTATSPAKLDPKKGPSDGKDPSDGSKKKVTLIIVDPQVDFHHEGSLPIEGADEDAERIADFINQNADSIDEIYITLDSHPR